jgi:hypothetical protein
MKLMVARGGIEPPTASKSTRYLILESGLKIRVSASAVTRLGLAFALRLRCSNCGKKAATVVGTAKPRPGAVPKNPH